MKNSKRVERENDRRIVEATMRKLEGKDFKPHLLPLTVKPRLNFFKRLALAFGAELELQLIFQVNGPVTVTKTTSRNRVNTALGRLIRWIKGLNWLSLSKPALSLSKSSNPKPATQNP
ncbi:MAG: hypothetical protein RJQ09_21295 [Cyclobacteriaceae bacterium]